MENKYYVGIGGSPRDSWDTYEDFAGAIEAAREMAVEMCTRTGDDPDTIDTWGEDDPAVGAGACPEGDHGGYWPCVMFEN